MLGRHPSSTRCPDCALFPIKPAYTSAIARRKAWGPKRASIARRDLATSTLRRPPITSRIAPDRPSTSPTSTSTPSLPVRTYSAPPERVATTGTPHAIASAMPTPKVSWRLADTKRSLTVRISRTRSRSTWPSRLTASPTPASRANARRPRGSVARPSRSSWTTSPARATRPRARISTSAPFSRVAPVAATRCTERAALIGRCAGVKKSVSMQLPTIAGSMLGSNETIWLARLGLTATNRPALLSVSRTSWRLILLPRCIENGPECSVSTTGTSRSRPTVTAASPP